MTNKKALKLIAQGLFMSIASDSSNKLMVGMERLELSRIATPEPKSGASTNFATSPAGHIIPISE